MDRYKVNRDIRTLLVKNAVDLSVIDFSFSGRTAYIRGELIKVDKTDFPVSQIEEIAREISRLPAVREVFFDLTNWAVTSTGESWQVIRLKKLHGRMPDSERMVEIPESD